MSEFLIGYGIGIATGVILAWYLIAMRVFGSDTSTQLARNNVTQAAFIASVSDVCSDEQCAKIQKRANERLEDLDVPGDPTWHYKDP